MLQEILQRRQDPWRWGTQRPAIRSWQGPLRATIETDALKLHEKLLKNSTSTFLRSFGIWNKSERWKSSVSGCLASWLHIKKLSFWSVVFSCFSTRLWCVMTSGFYMTTSSGPLSGWTEKRLRSTSQSPTCTQTEDHGHCLVVCCWSDPPHLSESWQNHSIWEMCSANWWDAPKTVTCSWHWSTGWPPIFSMTTPDHILHTEHLKRWTSWAPKFCLIHNVHLTSHQPITTSSSIWTTFCREIASTTSRRLGKRFPSLLNPEAWIFMLQE